MAKELADRTYREPRSAVGNIEGCEDESEGGFERAVAEMCFDRRLVFELALHPRSLN